MKRLLFSGHLTEAAWVTALVLSAATAAQAATIIDSADDATIAVEAYRSEAALFPSVGTVSGGGLGGSGVYLGNGWVLTAAHIALAKVGGTFAAWGQSFPIQNAVLHPEASLADSFADIGLLYIGTAGVGAATAMYDFGGSSSLLGREATWVGHGFGGTGRTGEQLPFDSRAFTNIIDALGGSIDGLPATSFVADFDHPDGSTNALGEATATRLEGNLATGDSGGGVFTEVNGQYYLIGINSYTGSLDTVPVDEYGAYGSLNGATNLQLYFDWIAAQTGLHPVPEPALAFLCATAAALAFRRQRPTRLV